MEAEKRLELGIAFLPCREAENEITCKEDKGGDDFLAHVHGQRGQRRQMHGTQASSPGTHTCGLEQADVHLSTKKLPSWRSCGEAGTREPTNKKE